MQEKRLYERFNVDFPAKYKLVNSPADADLFDAMVVDMGAAGLYFLTKNLLDLGETIELTMAIDSQNLVLTSTVIWLEKTGDAGYAVGVKIVDASMNDQAKLTQFYLDHLLASKID